MTKLRIKESEFIDGGEGTVLVRVVLSGLPGNDLHPFVTHIERKDNLGCTMQGMYCETAEEAETSYLERIKHMGGGSC